MPTLAAILAPLTLLLPVGLSPHAEERAAQPVEESEQAAPKISIAPQAQSWLPLSDAHEVPVYNQVRIEQRVIMRISPRRPTARQSLLADLQRQPRPIRVEERKIGKCIDAAGIVGVQSQRDDRLLFHMRDRSMISARLEKSCSARDYYSGFYVERHKDGRICIDRDRLMSRSGAKCQVTRLRQLVRVDDER